MDSQHVPSRDTSKYQPDSIPTLQEGKHHRLEGYVLHDAVITKDGKWIMCVGKLERDMIEGEGKKKNKASRQSRTKLSEKNASMKDAHEIIGQGLFAP